MTRTSRTTRNIRYTLARPKAGCLTSLALTVLPLLAAGAAIILAATRVL